METKNEPLRTLVDTYLDTLDTPEVLTSDIVEIINAYSKAVSNPELYLYDIRDHNIASLLVSKLGLEEVARCLNQDSPYFAMFDGELCQINEYEYACNNIEDIIRHIINRPDKFPRIAFDSLLPALDKVFNLPVITYEARKNLLTPSETIIPEPLSDLMFHFLYRASVGERIRLFNHFAATIIKDPLCHIYDISDREEASKAVLAYGLHEVYETGRNTGYVWVDNETHELWPIEPMEHFAGAAYQILADIIKHPDLFADYWHLVTPGLNQVLGFAAIPSDSETENIQ